MAEELDSYTPEGAELRGFSALIAEVQAALPEYFSIAIRPTISSDEAPFLVRLGNTFFPLDYYDPNTALQGLMELLGPPLIFDESKSDFSSDHLAHHADKYMVPRDALCEILSNLGEASLVLFIEKSCWYVHLYDHGYCFPLDKNRGAEFIDYCDDFAYS